MPREFRIYRPNKTNNGVASKWQLSFKKENKYEPWMLFLSITNQTGVDANGNATFNWDGAITVKLGENDVGEIIATLDGFQPQVGQKGSLFHQTPNGGNKIVSLQANDNGLFLRVSAQTADKKAVGPFAHNISRGEAAILSTLLKAAVAKMYDW